MNTRSAATDYNTVNTIEHADAEELFRKYGPMVTRRCRQLLANEDEAADAAQEVFVKLIDKKDRLTVKYPSSLLWTIATNHCLNLLRDKARRGGIADGETLIEKIACLDSGNDIEEIIGNRGILRMLFGRHPESSRTIAALHFIDGMTLEETAREINMSVSGVRKRLKALRDDLKKWRANEP